MSKRRTLRIVFDLASLVGVGVFVALGVNTNATIEMLAHGPMALRWALGACVGCAITVWVGVMIDVFAHILRSPR